MINWDKIENISYKALMYPLVVILICMIIAIECFPIGMIVAGALSSNWGWVGGGVGFGWVIYTLSIMFLASWKKGGSNG